MEATPFEAIEEFVSEDIIGSPLRSVNHSQTIQRLSAHLEQYDDEFDTFPELELKLNGKPVKPDISVYPNLPEDWDSDIIFLTEPPLIAVEVLSPKQGMQEVTDNMNTIYLPAGVKSVWIIMPLVQTVLIRTFDGRQRTFTEGLIEDSVTGIQIPFDKIFRRLNR